MALTPQAMMMLRRGPTMGATPTPGGAPPGAGPGAAPGGGVPGAGLPANPAAGDPGSLLVAAIAQRMSESKKANANFATSHIDQMLRVLSSMQIHLTQSQPGVARHLNRAWSALASAKKDLTDFAKEQGSQPGPPLGFSGAGLGPTTAGPPGVGPGNGGGGMGVPS